MIYLQEVADERFFSFEFLGDKLKKALKSKKCVNCKKPLKDPARIHYLNASNGEIRWWHDTYNINCILIK